MSVIISARCPEGVMGCTVQRRILYAMHRAGATAGSRHRKSAGLCWRRPKSVPPSRPTQRCTRAVRMAQPFSLRSH